MPVPMTCPECAADLHGEAIDPKYLDHYDGETCLSRAISLQDWETGFAFGWQCPDCDHQWALTENLSFGLRTFPVVVVIRRDLPGD